MSGGGDLLGTVLDRLLPPDGELPGAGGLGLAAGIPDEVAAPVLGALPPGFAALPGDAQVAALRAIEAAAPAPFAALVKAVYTAYYQDQRVLAAIERATGYAARPPQPLGYDMEPFDPALLEVVRNRPPHYRETRS
jgi:hypothetical protein